MLGIEQVNRSTDFELFRERETKRTFFLSTLRVLFFCSDVQAIEVLP
jgi:hypothetical protein